MSGAVEDYNDARIGSITQELAAFLDITPSEISISDVLAGNVVVVHVT
jgi:hypothetical protein